MLSIKNYYRLMKGKLTPVQMEGLRLLLTPFPQQQFNQTEDRKVRSRAWESLAWTATSTAIPTPPFI